ncbi:MAG: thymidine phosphorylase [Chlorobia bacterium]|nr:thymidine phosphorylase [Fimbriimonadaceae bacterium]
MNIVELISKKRDGNVHSYEDLTFIAQGAAQGTIPDYQLSAWLMAAYLNPLNEQETAWLTKAMAESGERIDLSGLPKPWVDKHSTGGVGDKTTIVLLPILAACGLTVIKMSGRGLGITGGTIDKLSSIPGFRLDLTPNEMKEQAAKIGLALTGQSPDLAPADKALYALRDVTATVGSIPLIVSSILSKKIAGGAETIVLDVKCGSGAFMETLEEAQELARQLVKTGALLGLSVKASISDMSQPLGATVGNALEVREALDVLQGNVKGTQRTRFRDLCLHYAGETLEACGKAGSIEEGAGFAASALESGRAFAKFKEWVLAQGGDAIWEADTLPKAPVSRTVSYDKGSTYVSGIDAQVVGQAVIDLGGGRKSKNDVIDLSVGVDLHVGIGDRIDQSDLFTVHAVDEASAEEMGKRIYEGISFNAKPVEPRPLILGSY